MISPHSCFQIIFIVASLTNILFHQCNELEVYVDEFALYQLDNPFQFRRYWFGHPSLPDTEILELYKNVSLFVTKNLNCSLPLCSITRANSNWADVD